MTDPKPGAASRGAPITDPKPEATGAQPPLENAAPAIGSPATGAGGWGAIGQTIRHSVRHMGLLRGTQTLLRTNQVGGFDCPGCAWPEPADRSPLEFCENGAKAVASEATTKRVTPAFFAEWSVEDLARQSDLWLNDQGRITHPMVRRDNRSHYEPIAWDAAFDLVAAELRALASPEQAAFYTSGRTSNEAAFLYQLFARQLGTNNLPDCSNMCHESTGAGMAESLGVGKGTVTLEDFAMADAIFVVGQNPGTNHPRMLTTLAQARERGCTIVAINPLNEAGNLRFAHPQDPLALVQGGKPLASLVVQVRINGDVAAFKGIMKAMLEREAAEPGSVLAHDFIRAHTEGVDAFAASLARVSWDDIVSGSGVAKEVLEQAARVACDARSTIVCWAMGLTQHKNGVANVQEIINFLLLRGNIGRPGAGACPVRGHSNVQGDRTMGIWERMPSAFLDRLGAEFDFEPPRAHGKDTVGTIRAMRAGDIRVFFAMGGNFLSASPDTERAAEALRSCALTAHVSTKLHRGHLVTGKTALILPCLARSEVDRTARGPQFVTVENSMSVVSMSRGELAPASDALRSEVAIVAGLARAALGSRSRVDWSSLAEDYDAIREHIGRVVPDCANYNARVRHPGGFYLGNAARDRTFRTPSGKARFTVQEIARHDLGADRLLLMTVRSHDQYNTTIYGLDDRYRGIKNGRRVVFMNPDDIRARDLHAGEVVDLVSHFDDGERVGERFAVVPYAIPRQCAATYFPEGNVLVPLDSVAHKSNTPASKSVVITVRKRRAPGPVVAYASGYGPNIELLAVDPATGSLSPALSVPAFGAAPTFLAITRGATNLYALDETTPGRVGAYAINPTTGSLTFLNDVPSGGSGPAHVSLDRSERYVLVANYGNGTVSTIAVLAGGRLGPPIQTLAVGAQAHMIIADPSNRFVFVPCKGADHVAQFVFDEASGILTPNAIPRLSTATGAGPRHLAFHPNGRFVYLVNELDNTIGMYALDSGAGTLSAVETKSTLVDGFTGKNAAAGIGVHPSGRWVLVSNRGDDSLVVFAIDSSTGKMSPSGHTKTGGATPRDFTFDEAGTFVFVANQGSGNVVPFRFDARDGTLSPTTAPVTVHFAAFVHVLHLPSR